MRVFALAGLSSVFLLGAPVLAGLIICGAYEPEEDRSERQVRAVTRRSRARLRGCDVEGR